MLLLLGQLRLPLAATAPAEVVLGMLLPSLLQPAMPLVLLLLRLPVPPLAAAAAGRPLFAAP